MVIKVSLDSQQFTVDSKIDPVFTAKSIGRNVSNHSCSSTFKLSSMTLSMFKHYTNADKCKNAVYITNRVPFTSVFCVIEMIESLLLPYIIGCLQLKPLLSHLSALEGDFKKSLQKQSRLDVNRKKRQTWGGNVFRFGYMVEK